MTKNIIQLDKGTISILIAISVHTGAAIWFASSLNSRVGAIETRQQNGVSAFERLIKVETNQDNLKETLKDALNEMRGSVSRIDANVQKLTDSKARK